MPDFCLEKHGSWHQPEGPGDRQRILCVACFYHHSRPKVMGCIKEFFYLKYLLAFGSCCWDLVLASVTGPKVHVTDNCRWLPLLGRRLLCLHFLQFLSCPCVYPVHNFRLYQLCFLHDVFGDNSTTRPTYGYPWCLFRFTNDDAEVLPIQKLSADILGHFRGQII